VHGLHCSANDVCRGAALLAEVGVESTLVEPERGQASLLARVPGDDSRRSALVVHGHLVVDASKNVHLVLPEDLDLWEELTGRSGEYRPGTASSHARKPTSTTVCTSPAHDVNTPMVCECGQIMLPLAQLERIVPVCEQCRIKRRLPAPRLKTIYTR